MNPFALYLQQEQLFSKALQEHDPSVWFPRLPGKPTKDQPGNWFVCFVPPPWGRWEEGNFGVHFDFAYGRQRLEHGVRRECMRLLIGVESPMKAAFRLRFKQAVIDAAKSEDVERFGLAPEARQRGRLLKLGLPFNNESWRIAMDCSIALQPLVRVVAVVIRQYDQLGAFEVPISLALRS